MQIQPIKTFKTTDVNDTDTVDRESSEYVRALLKAGVATSNIQVTPKTTSGDYSSDTAFVYTITVVAIDAKVK